MPSEAPLSIMGCNIEFPAGRRPFPAQLGLMSAMIRALVKGQNALLESPTGASLVLFVYIEFQILRQMQALERRLPSSLPL